MAGPWPEVTLGPILARGLVLVVLKRGLPHPDRPAITFDIIPDHFRTGEGSMIDFMHKHRAATTRTVLKLHLQEIFFLTFFGRILYMFKSAQNSRFFFK